MKKVKLIISILFMITTSASLGLGTYFTISYFRRSENKKFEAAYIYDTTFSTSVNVDLGLITANESKDLNIPVISLMDRKVNVEISIRGDENELNKYLDVTFDDQKKMGTVSDYINQNIKYSFTLDGEESRDVHIYYSLNKDDAIGDTNFVVFIQAVDYAPLSIEVEQ